jgi:hypothetical protein
MKLTIKIRHLNPIGQPISQQNTSLPPPSRNHKRNLPRCWALRAETSIIRGTGMTVTTLGIAHIQPIVSLIAGILILVMPQLLNYIVAIFLIVSGILGLGLIQ